MAAQNDTLRRIIDDALLLPSNAISYHVSALIAALLSDHFVLNSSDDDFDIADYAEAGHCTLVPHPQVFAQNSHFWDGRTNQHGETLTQGWYQIQWQGHTLEALMMCWQQEFSQIKHRWVIAESRELAEAFFDAVCTWNSTVRDEVLVFDGGCWQKQRDLFYEIQTATFDNLILQGTLKDDLLNDARHFFASSDLYDSYALPWKRGVMLIGPPGNGKTHAVKALINTLGIAVLYVKSFKSQYGTDDNNIRSVFSKARETTPCVLVLEDLDALVNDQNRSFFLNELDGFAANRGILTLATTNHPERLDAAILDRPSRFDRTYLFDLPAETERHNYLQLWGRSLPAEQQPDSAALAQVAAQTGDFSFAYLKELVLSAMVRWLADSRQGQVADHMLAMLPTLRAQMRSAQEHARPASVDHE